VGAILCTNKRNGWVEYEIVVVIVEVAVAVLVNIIVDRINVEEEELPDTSHKSLLLLIVHPLLLTTAKLNAAFGFEGKDYVLFNRKADRAYETQIVRFRDRRCPQ